MANQLTTEQMIKHCDERISKFGDIARVSYILPGNLAKTNKRSLCKGGPIGDILTENPHGPGVVVAFYAREVKQFLSTKPINQP